MIRIPIKNSPTVQHLTLSHILASPRGKRLVDKYGGPLIMGLTALTAAIESSGNATSYNHNSGASGVFQFLESTVRGIRKNDPSLPPWSKTNVLTQLEYFLSGMEDFIKRGPFIYNGFVDRGLIKTNPASATAKVIMGFRLAYHLWSFKYYDSDPNVRKEILRDLPLVQRAANVLAANLLGSRNPSLALEMSRDSINSGKVFNAVKVLA